MTSEFDSARKKRDALRLVATGGSDGHDGGMPPEERIAKLETHVEHMKGSLDRLDRTVEAIRARMDKDFRITWGGMIIAALGLAGLMAKGFKWI